MAAGSIPVSLQSVLSLSGLGIASQDASFKNVTVTSDKAIAVRRTQPTPGISLVDLASGSIVNTLNVAADWAVLSTDARILAVRGTFHARCACLSRPGHYSLWIICPVMRHTRRTSLRHAACAAYWLRRPGHTPWAWGVLAQVDSK